MAHEISIRRNGFAEMAFVGETPWHKLGQSVKQGASIEEWQRAAGMDWRALEAPCTYTRDDMIIGTTDQKAIYRSDTGECLSVMGKDYRVVQPAQVLSFFRDVTENGGWHIHTAGVLRGGRKLWAMASRDDQQGMVTRADRVKCNMLLATSLDGTSPTIAKPIITRVVCANTLGAAMSEGARVVRLSHKSIFDPAVIMSAMRDAGGEFSLFLEAAQRLTQTPINIEQARTLLQSIFAPATGKRADANQVVIASAAAAKRSKMADAKAKTALLLATLGAKAAAEASAPKDHRNVARILELFQGKARGADDAGSKGTAWGLLNATTEFLDHEAARTPDARLDSAWFGKGDAIKTRVFDALMAA